MSDFLECVNQRIIELQQVIQEKNMELADAPEGKLNICKTEKRVQFYYKDTSLKEVVQNEMVQEGRLQEEELSQKVVLKEQRRYLRNSEKQMVTALCQKDYNQKVFLAAQKELKQLEKLRNNYPDKTYEDVYEKLNIHRQKYVQPIILPDEEFIKNWEQVEYERKGFREEAPEYYTDKGERVRSKTEILIANALCKHNIPYRYEYPLYLNGYGMIHPDFTVLNVRLRKEFYWEHMGMMDNPDYMEEAFRRITMYEKNNIFPGDKLILTHETLKYPINPQNIEKMIFQYLH